MPKILVLKRLREYPRIGLLKEDFANYKQYGELPDYFGRDAPYHWPDGAVKANLFHLHLAESNIWPEWQDQYSRTSDHHLVYCQSHRTTDSYGFLTVLQPDAHNQAESLDTMNRIVDLAEMFHKTY